MSGIWHIPQQPLRSATGSNIATIGFVKGGLSTTAVCELAALLRGVCGAYELVLNTTVRPCETYV